MHLWLIIVVCTRRLGARSLDIRLTRALYAGRNEEIKIRILGCLCVASVPLSLSTSILSLLVILGIFVFQIVIYAFGVGREMALFPLTEFGYRTKSIN